MNRYYCNKKCPKGIKASEEFLNKNNSAYDAAIDFISFTKKCYETCPYKELCTEEENEK